MTHVPLGEVCDAPRAIRTRWWLTCSNKRPGTVKRTQLTLTDKKKCRKPFLIRKLIQTQLWVLLVCYATPAYNYLLITSDELRARLSKMSWEPCWSIAAGLDMANSGELLSAWPDFGGGRKYVRMHHTATCTAQRGLRYWVCCTRGTPYLISDTQPITQDVIIRSPPPLIRSQACCDCSWGLMHSASS